MTSRDGRSTLSPAALLAAIPIFDALINQLSTANIAFGPLSLLQAARALELALLATVLVWALFERPRMNKRLARLFVFALIFIGSVVATEIRRYGAISATAVIGIGQFLYVLVLWLSATALCRRPGDARMVLAGIATGGLISALSVLVSFSTQSRLTEVYHGVVATSGLFFSAKYLVGNWIVGGLLWMYLLRKRFKIVGMMAAGLCFLSLFATYNRTGQVCLVMSIAWLAYWNFTVGRSSTDAAWVRRLLLVSCSAIAVFLLASGVADLSQRWSDLAERDTAGSGRLLLWITSALWVSNASGVEVIAGSGFRGMFDIIEQAVGVRIHTHSDLFDFLLIGGLIGLALYFALVRDLWVAVRRQDRRASVHAIGVAAFLTFALSSVLTGQLTQPTAMTTYVLAVVATGVASRTYSRAAL